MKKTTLLALLGIMLLAAFFRFYDIGSIPRGLYPDEAMNGSNALEALSAMPPAGGFKFYYPENNGREGLFINIQALSIAIFGNEPWALRLVSAVFGTLTVLGVFFLARALFKDDELALLAALFLATSFWHINFSRIGFRAIMAPFFLTWGTYFLWRALFKNNEGVTARKNLSLLFIGGLFFGGGFHSYIAYRVAPLLLIFPFIKHLKKTLAAAQMILTPRNEYKKFFAAWGIFLAAGFFAALPLLGYYALHPADFFGRTSQISIFSLENPVREFATNAVKTVGMFFWNGDYNWRHNLSGTPELWWPVAIFFILGIAISLSRRDTEHWFLFSWVAVMLMPVVISAEGIPHALRAILVIPPVMIISAIGAKALIDGIRDWFKKNIIIYPEYARQLARIQKETRLLLAVFIIALVSNVFISYFWRWGENIETYNAFSGRYAEIGYYLRTLPVELPKYVIVNANGVDVRGLPMPTQTIIYLTDTFTPDKQLKKNLHYLMPRAASTFSCQDKCFVVTLEHDTALYGRLKEKTPGLALDTSPGFVALRK